MSANFADLVLKNSAEKESNLLLALRPELVRMPPWLLDVKFNAYGRNWAGISEAIIAYDRLLIETAAPHILGIMPRLSYYQMYGAYGVRALERTIVEAIERDLVVIMDAKMAEGSEEIGKAASTFLGEVTAWVNNLPSNLHVHAMTVIPYFGESAIKVMVDLCKQYKRGFFVLVKDNASLALLEPYRQELMGESQASSLGLLFDDGNLENLHSHKDNNSLKIFRDRYGDQLDKLYTGLSATEALYVLPCIEDVVLNDTQGVTDEQQMRQKVTSRVASIQEKISRYLVF